MARNQQSKDDRIVLRKHDRLGVPDAEEDTDFLENCFVSTGDLELLVDCERSERIVLGRTGTGKSALLLKLLKEPHAIEVKPENLALSYITNSTILQFFEHIGVNLDPFYKLIWRHAFCVELLRERFGLTDRQERFSLVAKIKALFKGGQYSAAMKYLENWGDAFWEGTEHRVKEITRKVEDSLQGTLRGELGLVGLSSDSATKLTEEQRIEVIQRAQNVVNDAHVPQLSQILDLVRDVIDDEQKRYYIVIDRLDESWAEDRLRYKLIMALIDTVKEFRRVPNAKIVLAIRIDLLHRVFKHARHSGFQEEKIESLYLRLRWSREALVALIESRLNHLFRDRYSKTRSLSARDILVDTKRDVSSLDYILARTFMRPRDVICFLNECLSAAEGKAKIALRDIRAAEHKYSNGRLRSIADEWHAEFPNLFLFASTLLAGAPTHSKLSDVLSDAQLQNHCLSLHARDLPQDNLSEVCTAVVSAERPCFDMIRAAFSIFFRVGLVGVKPNSTGTYVWYADTGRRIDATELTAETSITLHPMFWRALGADEPDRKDSESCITHR